LGKIPEEAQGSFFTLIVLDITEKWASLMEEKIRKSSSVIDIT